MLPKAMKAMKAMKAAAMKTMKAKAMKGKAMKAKPMKAMKAKAMKEARMKICQVCGVYEPFQRMSDLPTCVTCVFVDDSSTNTQGLCYPF